MIDKTTPPIGVGGSAPVSIRDQVLFRAGELINGERQIAYGDATANFRATAAYWSIYLNTVIIPRGSFLPSDVPMFMIFAKIAREAASFNIDGPIDICGYAALYGEVRSAETALTDSTPPAPHPTVASEKP